jgi:hypothetical protein
MTHDQLVTAVIDGGVAGVRRDYSRPEQARELAGSVAGFEACRGKSVPELADLLGAARIATEDARKSSHGADYWWFRCYEAEVEWVCNVVSASLLNAGLPTIVPPTAPGMLAAAQIIGVKDG